MKFKILSFSTLSIRLWVFFFIPFLSMLICFSSVRAGVHPLAYVSCEGGIAIIDIEKNEKLKTISLPGSMLRGIGIDKEGKTLFVADKSTQSLLILDASNGQIKNTIRLGQNPEFLRLDPERKFLFVSYEPELSESSPIGAKIAQIDIQKEKIDNEFSGGKETEAIEFSKDGSKLLVANEGENSIGLYDIETRREIRRIDLQKIGTRPRGLKRAPQEEIYAVTFENSNTLALFDHNFSLLKATTTASGPYGVAFDPSGKRVLVLAFRDRKLQVFDSQNLKLLAEAPVGMRSWHFTFSPDGRKILVASGRSDAIHVFDANNYKELAKIEGIKMPWGIITYPLSYGSLDSP
ncbi:beta-propeller fold lactonase family protein [Methylacidiphilum kamchatkense]|uniref:beta-propeller fold lactonase family protein n=1 Tax=Methylacidiphilum kamchatkense TaxID=431057 RepID=UPI001F34E1E9|nr:beta-propeller fold lactonase family protein [Methylacidiphilum kamchatkense]